MAFIAFWPQAKNRPSHFIEPAARLEMNRRQHEIFLLQLCVLRRRILHELPMQTIRARERRERPESGVMAEINMAGDFVAPLRIGIVGVRQHFQIHEAQHGIGVDEVVLLVPGELDEAEVRLVPLHTVIALGVCSAPPRGSDLVLRVVVKRDIPHPEPALLTDD